jgi:hypothetical protein
MKERLTAVVGARIHEFKKRMAEVNRTMRQTATSVVVDVKARTEKAQNKLDRIARTLSSIQVLAGNFAMGSLITVSPATIPILAATAGGLMALVTYLGLASAAAVSFGAVAIPTIAKLFSENAKLTAQQERARGSFDKFKATYQGIVKELEKPVLEAFTKSMEVATQIITMAKPLFHSATKAVNNLLASLKASLGTPPIKAFFDYMNTQGGPMLEKFGKTMGNFMKGFMSMMVAFGPLSESFAQGFLNMSQRFAEWAAQLPKSEKFQSFIAYVQANGPKVLSLIGNLTMFLVNLGIALAPLGTKLLDLTNKFLSWSSTMLETNPTIGKMIGYGIVLLGLFKMFVPAILTAASFFSGFGGTLVKVASKLGPLFSTLTSNIVIGLRMMGAQALKQGARMAAGLVIAMGPVAWVTAGIIALVALVIWKWKEISSFTKKYWTMAWNLIKAVWANIVSAVTRKVLEVYTKVSSTFNNVVSFLQGLKSTFYDAGKGLIEQMIKGIKNMAGKVMSAVSSIASKVRDFLPFSPAKIGPLKDIGNLNFGGPIADSIMKAKREIQSAMGNMLQVPDFGMTQQMSASVNHSMTIDRTKEEPEKEREVVIMMDGREVGYTVERHVTEAQDRNKARSQRVQFN